MHDVHRHAGRRHQAHQARHRHHQHAEHASGRRRPPTSPCSTTCSTGASSSASRPGGLLSDAEVFGNLDANRNEMFLEAINQVLAIWAGEPPYNIEGKYWKVSTARTLMADIGQGILAKPLQKPHPPIVVTAVAPFSKGVTEAAARGWDPISANFLMPQWVKSHWPKYVEGCQKGGRPGRPGQLARGQEHLRRRRRQEGARVRDGAEQPLPALLQQPADQAEDGRPRRGLQDLARAARQRRDARRRDRQAGDLGLAAEGGRRAAWPSARRSATSARCSTPARTGSTATSAAAPWCCWRRRCCRRSMPPSPGARRRRSSAHRPSCVQASPHRRQAADAGKLPLGQRSPQNSMQDSQARRLAAKCRGRASIQARSKSRIDWEGRPCPTSMPPRSCAAAPRRKCGAPVVEPRGRRPIGRG